MKRWYRNPGPGQFRGEGDWFEALEDPSFGQMSIDHWENLKETGYLPVGWSVDDHEPVPERERPHVVPTFLLQDDAVIHQHFKIAVPLKDVQSEMEVRAAAQQLASLCNHLIEKGELTE